jgi:hypothetical protein
VMAGKVNGIMVDGGALGAASGLSAQSKLA